MILDRLRELLPRRLAIWLGLRRVSPVGDYWPRRSVHVAPIDTGGGFRAAWRMQVSERGSPRALRIGELERGQ